MVCAAIEEDDQHRETPQVECSEKSEEWVTYPIEESRAASHLITASGH